jgi:serine/threonine-protein kinase
MSNPVAGGGVPPELAAKFRLNSSPRFTTAQGVIYEGIDPSSGVPVLFKALREPAFASAPDRQRVRRELQKLAQVRHGSLASVIDSGDAGDVTWYVRDYIPGDSLADVLTERGALSVAQAASVALRVAGALAELHRHGVLHRDLRAGHVILGHDGTVRLIDAGVSRVFRTAEGKTLTGTPGAISPEAIGGKLVSFRSDLYALGTLLYEMLTGRAVFAGEDDARRVQLQAEKDLEPLGEKVAPALAQLVVSLTAREPRERPFSAQQVERQLEPFYDERSLASLILPEREVAAVVQTLAQEPPSVPQPPPPTPSSNGISMTTTSVRNVNPQAPAVPASVAQALEGDDEDRADEAPTRLTAGLDMPPPQPPSGPPAASSASPSGAAPKLPSMPKMPTIPPIPMGIRPPQTTSAAVPPPPGRGTNPPVSTSTLLGMQAPALAAMSSPADRKATLLGMPRMVDPNDASSSPQAGGDLDYEDLGDTTVNEESRMFGMPVPSAVGADVMSSRPPPAAGYPGNNGAAQSTGFRTAQGVGPNNGGYGPTGGYPQQPPAQGAPYGAMQGQPMPAQGPMGYQGPQGPILANTNPAGPHQVQMGAPGMMGHGEYVVPKKSAAPWIAGIIGVVALASIGGLAVARYQNRESSQQTTVVLTQPETTTHTGSLQNPSTTQPAMNPMVAPTQPAMQPTQPTAPTPETQPGMQAMQPVAPTPTPQPTANTAPPATQEPTPAPARTTTRSPTPAPAPQNSARTTPQNTAPAARTQPATTAPANTAARTQPATTTAPATTARTGTTAQTTPTPAPATGGAVAANDPRITAALQQRNYAAARPLLQSAVRSNPNNAQLHAQLANALERTGDQRGALTEYAAATRLDRRNTNWLFRLADLQRLTGDRNGAIASYQQILRLIPNDPAATRALQQLQGGH